jgi:hypothetical protein
VKRTTIALALAWLGWAPATLGAAAAPGAFTLTVAGGRVSLQAEDAPLQRILDEIGDRTGVRVRLDEHADPATLNEPVGITLDRVPVEEALRRLLRGKNFVLVGAPARLSEVRVYSREHAAARTEAAAVSASPGAVATEEMALMGLRNSALNDASPSARARALEGLAANAGQRIVRDTIMEVLQRETLRGLVDRALDIIAGDQSIPLEPLINLATTSVVPALRIKALTRLSEHLARDPQARRVLEVAAGDDATPEVRDAARTLLRQRGTP